MESEYKHNNKHIAKNTFMLYVRQLITVIVALYTVRIVLDVLGAEDYGIYTVIGGVVMLLSFLTGAMTSATQRFFSFHLGRNDIEKLKQVFSMNIIIYLIMAVVVFVILETLGLWFVRNNLNVPEYRSSAAEFIYHVSILIFICNMLYTPLIATITAHEDMHIFAYISIFDVVMKLGAVILLQYIDYENKLELYSVLLLIASLITALVYYIVCLYRYKECQFRKLYIDKKVFKEIFNFTGWALFGSLTTVMRMQGVTILLNQFFNPLTVAARAIASQVTGQLGVFSDNFSKSIYPPIIKNFATGNIQAMYNLICQGSKITFFLMWVVALPLWLYMDVILELWLGDVPDNAILFTRLAIFEVLIQSISYPIMAAARAAGKMKVYELSLGTMQIILFTIVWLVFYLGGPDYSLYYVVILMNLVIFFIRLFIVNKLVGLPIRRFIFDVVVRMLILSIISSIVFYWMTTFCQVNLIQSILVMILSVLLNIVLLFAVGLRKDEKKQIFELVKDKLSKK